MKGAESTPRRVEHERSPAVFDGPLPRRAPQVVIGPDEYVDGKILRFAKHRESGVYFRLGEREAFLLQRLDGTQGFAELAAGYRAAFGTPLAPQSLGNALALFERRRLIECVGADRQAPTSAPALPIGPSENALSFRFLYWNPDAVIGRVAPRLRWLFNGPVLAVWALGLVIAQLALLPHLAQLWGEATEFERRTVPLRAVVLVALYSLVTLLHETGHALACKRHGGEVREMGVMLRYFIFSAYTRVDDILLFHDRGHRIQVLAAGPLISFSLIPIAFAVWLNAPAESIARLVAVDVLVWFNLACLSQLLPFLQSDGYFMLAQWLRMPELRKDAAAYLFGRFLAVACRRRMPSMPARCAAHVVPVCVLYGLLSFGVTAGVAAWMLSRHARMILELAGRGVGLAVVAVLGALLLWSLVFSFVPWARAQHAKLLPETTA